MITSQAVETNSVAETIAFGAQLASQLRAGDVLALSGELGAGKTVLIKGIAHGLGVEREVTSPTFTLIHEYDGGRLPLFHLDLYRLDKMEQALAIGIEEYLLPAGATIIEWAEKIGPLLPENSIRIHIEHISETRRRIRVE